MQDAENIIKVFTTRVRQLIMLVAQLKKEKAELNTLIEQRDSHIKELNDKIALMEKDYQTMTMAKMLTLTDDNLDDTKHKISRLITSVDRCITLLGKAQSNG